MKLIIDISDEDCAFYISMYNGIPLPKRHGRLIDENDVIKIHDNNDRVWWENALDDIKEFVPTIIEADKGDMKC